MSNIPPTGSMTAATCTACSWFADHAKAAGSAVVALATKVASFVTSVLQTAVQHASTALSWARNQSVTGMNLLKANPQIAIGGLAVAALAAAAIYAYNQSV